MSGPSPESHFERTVQWGRYINNQVLAKILAEESPSRLLELRKFNVEVIPRKGGIWVTGPPSMFGKGLVDPLQRTALEMGVKALERVMVIDLMSSDGTVTGALGLDSKAELVAIEAKATILATGGAGQVYSRTDNPSGIAGDGYAMAFRAGADLLDMEFVQFSPLGLAEAGMPVMAFSIPPSILVNELGENIMEKYNLIPEEHSDSLARAIVSETGEGARARDNSAVMADLSKIPEEFWKGETNHAKHIQWLLRKHKDKRFVRIFPFAHYFLGGVLIDEKSQTGIAGLYAAGEVAGGVHGANRIGGNALPECIVFGARAGASAAEYAKTVEKPGIDQNSIEEKGNEIKETLDRPQEHDNTPRTIKKRIQEAMWKNVGITRNQEGLRRGLTELEVIDTTMNAVAARNRIELIEAFEAENMLETAKIVASAAQFRKESRGSHYRADHPTRDDKGWLKNVIITPRDDGLKLSARSAILTELSP
jgi:fumarate reductase (CoM/CoB) subunit A